MLMKRETSVPLSFDRSLIFVLLISGGDYAHVLVPLERRIFGKGRKRSRFIVNDISSDFSASKKRNKSKLDIDIFI